MEIEVAGQKMQLGTNPLGDPMDAFLSTLFTKFFSEFEKPYESFMKNEYDELKANIHAYFDQKIDELPGQDFLFNNLTIIWDTYQRNGRLEEAQLFWQDILKLVLEWENTRQSRIHKGSLFFFWSQSALLQGELDKGFFLIHSAYEEDVITHNNQLPATPGFRTVALDYDDQRNFLYPIVESWSNFLTTFIDNYQKLSGHKFTLDEFRNLFLYKPPDRDTLFSFTYTLARFHHFDTRIPREIINGNFASLFELNALFDLVLIIDSLIYSKLVGPAPNDWGFKNLLKHLLIESGIEADVGITRGHLEEINTSRKNNFEATIIRLLDQSFVYQDGKPLSRLECDIGLAFCIRNYGAHKIGSFPIINSRYVEIRQSVFNVLFLATESLN